MIIRFRESRHINKEAIRPLDVPHLMLGIEPTHAMVAHHQLRLLTGTILKE
jgi:hypothetical protein